MARYVTIRESGSARNWDQTDDIWKIMDDVYTEMRTAGSNHDAVNMLLLDGKVVVDKNFHNIAYGYGSRLTQLQQAAKEKAREEYQLGWMP